MKPWADYDKENDTLFLRFGEAEKAQTIQFGDWLMLRVGTENGRILAIEINGFGNLKRRVTDYVKRHRGRVSKVKRELGKFDVSFDRDSDSLWVRIRKGDGERDESVVTETVNENLIAYRGKDTGKIIAIRFPQYTRRWYALLKDAIEAFTEEIMKESPRRGVDKRRKAVGELIAQVNPAQLEELAGIGA
jgi:uncharacterized protein YuzE